MMRTQKSLVFILLAATLLLAACGAGAPAGEAVSTEKGPLPLPELSPADLTGGPLQVIATTSIIGDVVSQVGRDQVRLTTLMAPGQDPHSYQPTTADFAAVANADVIFVNGWDLEEALAQDLAEIAGEAPVIPISANIEPLFFSDEDAGEEIHEDGDHEDEGEHEHSGGVDPHVWLDVANVRQWVLNAVEVLSSLDPPNAGMYQANGDAYIQELDALDAEGKNQLGRIPLEDRVLVTNHNSYRYFARAYGFEVAGTVIPAASTLAEPSAQSLAGLVSVMQENGVCTIFSETTVSDSLAQTVTAELENCSAVRVIPLYSGATGPAGSGAETYIGMMRHNFDAISDGLTREGP